MHIKVKVKGKVHPGTGHEGPKGEYRYSSALSLTSALDGVGVNALSLPLYPLESHATRRKGGWVGPGAGLARCGKSHLHRDSISEPSTPQRVAIPTEISRPTLANIVTAM